MNKSAAFIMRRVVDESSHLGPSLCNPCFSFPKLRIFFIKYIVIDDNSEISDKSFSLLRGASLLGLVLRGAPLASFLFAHSFIACRTDLLELMRFVTRQMSLLVGRKARKKSVC